MMVLKKKEIIAASLVVLIGLAGYLNWSYQDTVNVRDGESYIETGKKLGEAQYVNSVEEVEENGEAQEASENTETVSGDSGYFEQARLDKEKSRHAALHWQRHGLLRDGAVREPAHRRKSFNRRALPHHE